MAAARLFDRGNRADNQLPAIDPLSLHCFRQLIPDGALSEDTDYDRIGGVLEDLRRPFHKLGQVVNIGRLDVVFVDLLGARNSAE